MATGTGFYSIIDYTVDGHDTQKEVVEAFAENSDTDGRMTAIGEALEGLSGQAEPRMSGVPTYTVVREVGPGPQRLDA